jgi:hypothetical protein
MSVESPAGEPEGARWPRVAAEPHRSLRSLLPRGYVGYTEATAPRHLILPASAAVPLVVKLVDSPYRPPQFIVGAHGPYPVAMLGLEFIDADVEAGTIEPAFKATEAFTNPAGNVLGAFTAAMLYDTVRPALRATLAPDQFQSTLQLNVSFLWPVRPGRPPGSR